MGSVLTGWWAIEPSWDGASDMTSDLWLGRIGRHEISPHAPKGSKCIQGSFRGSMHVWVGIIHPAIQPKDAVPRWMTKQTNVSSLKRGSSSRRHTPGSSLPLPPPSSTESTTMRYVVGLKLPTIVATLNRMRSHRDPSFRLSISPGRGGAGADTNSSDPGRTIIQYCHSVASLLPITAGATDQNQ